MKYVIVYWSRYGNGKKIVDNLSKKLKEKKGKIQTYNTEEVDPTSMPDADVYIFSAPTEAFSIQKNMKKFMKNLKGMEEKNYGIINTHAMKKNTLHKMEKILSNKKMIKIAEIDFQVGEGSKTGDGIINNWELELEDFVKKL